MKKKILMGSHRRNIRGNYEIQREERRVEGEKEREREKERDSGSSIYIRIKPNFYTDSYIIFL